MGLLDNLVAWWKLDEASGNAIDAHAAYDLTDNNTVGAATGHVGGARDFTSASSEYLEHADNADFSPGDSDFSIAGWFRMKTDTIGTLIGKWQFGSGLEYHLYYQASTDQFAFGVSANGSSEVATALSSAVAIATWYYIVVWHDSVANTVNIQVNDGAVVSVAHSGGIYDGTSPLRIGQDGSAGALNGLADEVAFWRRVLTAGERTALYNGGAGLTYEDLDALTPEITTTTLPGGTEGSAYSQTLAVTGGIGAKTWSIVAGALPDGLSLNPSTGAITGTPTVPGVFAFTVRATDTASSTDDQALSITIAVAPITAEDFPLIDQTAFRIAAVAPQYSILQADYGDGYRDTANVGMPGGVKSFTAVAGLWSDDSFYGTIDGQAWMEYYYEFLNARLQAGNSPFRIVWRGKYWLVDMDEPRYALECLRSFNSDMFVPAAIRLNLRRVRGIETATDGSVGEVVEPVMLLGGGEELLGGGEELIG